MNLLINIVKKLLMVVPILFFLSLVIFSITTLFDPYTRATLYIRNPQELRGKALQYIIRLYGFDQPFHIQYLNWLGQILSGNLGWSETSNMPVLQTILVKISRTAEVILFSLPIVIVLGIFLGIISARNKGRLIDHALKTLATIGWALPAFVFAIILLAIFFSGLGWFPPGAGGMPLRADAVMFVRTDPRWHTYTGLFTIDGILNGQLWITLDALRHFVLPTLVLTIGNITIVILVVRSGILEKLKERSIAVTPVAGLPPSEVTMKVKRSNVALFPANILSVLLFVSMLSSIIITEVIFDLDGLGRWVALAAGTGGGAPDIAALVGFMLLWGFTFVIVNLIAEIVYACVEAKIR